LVLTGDPSKWGRTTKKNTFCRSCWGGNPGGDRRDMKDIWGSFFDSWGFLKAARKQVRNKAKHHQPIQVVKSWGVAGLGGNRKKVINQKPEEGI